MKEFQIQKNEAGQRFDKYLKKRLPLSGGSFIYKMLRKKNITLNGKKSDGSDKIKEGDQVVLFLSDETFLKFSGESDHVLLREKLPQLSLGNLPFNILYEDEDVIVIDKPSGMLSQKAKETDVSANEYIISYLLASKALTLEELKTFHPSVVNRLDRNTSGILMAGKTLLGSQKMSLAIKNREVKKYYTCIVEGHVQEEKIITGYLLKDEETNRVQILEEKKLDSRWIETKYKPIAVFKDYTLLEILLVTGRPHQIRAHLASINHPILGDFKYGNVKQNQYWKKIGVTDQLLHASRLELAKNKVIEAPLPLLFENVLKVLTEKI